MKKNRMMKSAAGLLVAVLLTTSMTSSTFAKYTTSASGSDTARVAKWGVAITASGDMFFDTYKPLSNGSLEYSVDSSDGENVLAPGTSGNLVAMSISGSPEVAVKVDYEVDIELNGWSISTGEIYCPLIITVGEEEFRRQNNQSIDKFEETIEAAIRAYSTEYAPNVDLASTASMPKISWSWPFDGNNDYDTQLGNKADEGNAATISLSVRTTVTQID